MDATPLSDIPPPPQLMCHPPSAGMNCCQLLQNQQKIVSQIQNSFSRYLTFHWRVVHVPTKPSLKGGNLLVISRRVYEKMHVEHFRTQEEVQKILSLEFGSAVSIISVVSRWRVFTCGHPVHVVHQATPTLHVHVCSAVLVCSPAWLEKQTNQWNYEGRPGSPSWCEINGDRKYVPGVVWNSRLRMVRSCWTFTASNTFAVKNRMLLCRDILMSSLRY